MQLPLVACMVLLLNGCVKDKLTTTHTAFEPVYKSKAAVLQDIKGNAAMPLKHTGKIALYGQYIFINEVNKGVHIIDNTNKMSPKNIAFINIPGNLDIAIKNNVLYADIYTDLLAIDIANLQNVSVKKINYNVFPEKYLNAGFSMDTSNYIVDWIVHEATTQRDIDALKGQISNGAWISETLYQADNYSNTANASGGNKANSIGGSMARFTLVNDFLYTVGRSALSSFNVSNAANPVLENTTQLGWNIETIFPLNNKLFIGAQTGMFIYNIDNPASPAFQSSFVHACFDDPVIANERYAFVTLKATTAASNCWGFAPQQSQMDVLDISNINQPTLIRIYDMEEPMGLSLDGNNLFVCDGKGGLKIYNAADVDDLQLLRTINNINPFDVIAYNKTAIVVAKEGILQFDYSDITAVRHLSTLAIENK